MNARQIATPLRVALSLSILFLLCASCVSGASSGAGAPLNVELGPVVVLTRSPDALRRAVVQGKSNAALKDIARACIDMLYSNGWRRVADLSSFESRQVSQWGGIFENAGRLIEIGVYGGLPAGGTHDIHLTSWGTTPMEVIEHLRSELRECVPDAPPVTAEFLLGASDSSDATALREITEYERTARARLSQRVPKAGAPHQ